MRPISPQRNPRRILRPAEPLHKRFFLLHAEGFTRPAAPPLHPIGESKGRSVRMNRRSVPTKVFTQTKKQSCPDEPPAEKTRRDPGRARTGQRHTSRIGPILIDGQKNKPHTPSLIGNKKETTLMDRLFALSYPDSNQEKQDQNLLCYHYTIAQYLAELPVLRLLPTVAPSGLPVLRPSSSPTNRHSIPPSSPSFQPASGVPIVW